MMTIRCTPLKNIVFAAGDYTASKKKTVDTIDTQ